MDEELRRLERDARTDADARVRWLAALRRSGAPPTWPTAAGPWSGNRDFADVELRPPLRVEWQHAVTSASGDGLFVGGAGQVLINRGRTGVRCLDLTSGEMTWERAHLRERHGSPDLHLAGGWLLAAGRSVPLDDPTEPPRPFVGRTIQGPWREGHRTRLLTATTVVDLEDVRSRPHARELTWWAPGRVDRGVYFGQRRRPGASDDPTLDAVDLRSGAVRFRAPARRGEAVVAVSSELLVTVVVPKPSDLVGSVAGTTLPMCVRSAIDGSERWAANVLPASAQPPLLSAGCAVHHAAGGAVEGRDAVTGALRWSWQGGSVLATNLVATRGHVWVGVNRPTRRHDIVALDVATGDEVWIAPQGATVSTLSVIDDRLVALVGRTVTCFAPEGAPSSVPAKKPRKKRA